MPVRLKLPCGPGWKTCAKCREPWLLVMFRPNPKLSDGYVCDCMDCARKRGQEKYANRKARPSCKKAGKPSKKRTLSEEQIKERAYQQRLKRVLYPEKTKAMQDRYYEKHREVILARAAPYRRAYYHAHKDAASARAKVSHRKRRATDPEFRMKGLLRSRIGYALKGGAKSARTMELVGCDIETLHAHFTSLFTEGMTMEAFMRGEIHIDHKIPCSAFDLSDPAQQRQCFHYTNLQPMWATDNLRKGDKVTTVHGSSPECAGRPVSARIYRGKTGRAVAEDGLVAPFEPHDSASSPESEQSKAA
jgi:hypothetical protein